MALIFSPSSPEFHAGLGRGNASTCCAILVALLFASARSLSSAANVYNVGDNVGWTISANYSAWASSKIFSVGDTIVFIYNKSFHNVVEVTKADYRSCNAASPIATHATGNDSIPITRYGHRFFICGFPGHCAAGQKLDVRVPKHSTAASPATAAPPSGGGTSPAASAPGSAPNGGGGTEKVRGFGVVAVAVAVAATAVLLLG